MEHADMTRIRTGTIVTTLGLGLLAACSDQTTAPVTDASTPTMQGVTAGVPIGQFWQRGSPELAAPSKPGRVSLLTYHNGPVIKTSKTMAIFWGPQWTGGTFPADVVPGIDQFYAGWGNSRYNGLNTEYGDATSKITSASSYLGHVFDNTTAPSGALSTAAAVAEGCAISGQNPDPDAIYVIYTPTYPSGVGYCAWHSWGNCSNGKPIQVAYEPNPSGVAGCDPGDATTGHSQMLASLVNTSAHEVAEAETDPRGTGWFDRQGNENADKCAWQFNGLVTLANGASWKIQKNWSNAAAGCLQGS
jgi:hypothetical protein